MLQGLQVHCFNSLTVEFTGYVMNRICYIIAACVIQIIALASIGSGQQKIEQRLQTEMDRVGSGEPILAWVYFTDKGTHEGLRNSVPRSVVSNRSLIRRAKVRSGEALVDYADLPVEQSYVAQVSPLVTRVRQLSRWFNCVSVVATKAQIERLQELPFVRNIDLVARFPRNNAVSETEHSVSEPEGDSRTSPAGINTLNYGTSYAQVNQIGVPAVHDLGNHAEGVVVGVFDNGFRLLTHQAFDSLHIIATYDFVDHKVSVVPLNPSTSFGAHGVNTLSTIGGYWSGQLIGPAFKANYILARTENDSSETPIEEDNWAAAIEWADSIGVDVTSTSLGYLTYDSPYPSWTWQDMNGNTTLITRAADMAVARGILVVNSAGNDGFNASHNTLGAPADGDSVFTIGAVDSFGVRSSFSSVGPTTSVPPRIKPDVMAMGTSVKVASATNTTSYARSSGTSFSCPLAAGAAALMVKAWPNATPVQIMDAMRSTASRASTPDNSYGWGIINVFAAMQPRVPTLVSPLSDATNQPTSITLTWNVALGASAYRLQLATDSLFTAVVADDSTLTGTSMLINSLNNGTRYFWRVRSKNMAGVSTYSSQWNFTTTSGVVPPGLPALISPANNSLGQPLTVSLRWSRPAGATGYHLQVAVDSGFLSLVVNDSTVVDTTLQVNLQQSTRYYWRANARNSAGTSAFTTPWSFQTLVLPPPAPTLVFPGNGSIDQPRSLSLVWRTVPTGGEYQLQLALDSLFTSIVLDDSSLADTSHTVSSLPSNSTLFWRVRARNPGGAGSFSAVWRFSTTAQISQRYPVTAGWNIVSVPLRVSDYRKSVLYPTAISSAYAFRQGYAVADTLEPDAGYWLKFGGTDSVLMTGIPRTNDTIAVSAGWNLIGTPTVDIPVASIIQSPPALVQSSFFAYGGSYAIADTLHPGQGYWVKCAGPGMLVIVSTTGHSAAGSAQSAQQRRRRTTFH